MEGQLTILTNVAATIGALPDGVRTVVTKEDLSNPGILLVKQEKVAAIASSYDVEKAAM